MIAQQSTQEKRTHDADFEIRDAGSSFTVNANSTHTPIGAIEVLKLARAKASADLDKLLRPKTEQKKFTGVYSVLSPIVIVITYLLKLFSLYKLVNWKYSSSFRVNHAVV